MKSVQLDENTQTRFEILNVDHINLIFVAVLASLASFLNRHAGPEGQEPRKWSWMRFFAHLTASIFSAILASNLAIIMGVDNERILFAIAGVCGWAGKEGVDWLIYVIRMKVLNAAGLARAANRESHNYGGNEQKSGRNEYAERDEPCTNDIDIDINTEENPGSLRRRRNIDE